MRKSNNKTTYDSDFITTEQLAERWSLEPGTLEIWRQRGKGPKWVKLTDSARSTIRYQMKTILEYEASQTMSTTTTKE